MKLKNLSEETSIWHTKNKLLFSYTQGDWERFHHRDRGRMPRPGPRSISLPEPGKYHDSGKIRTSKIQPILSFSSFCKATSGFTQFLNPLGAIVEKITTA